MSEWNQSKFADVKVVARLWLRDDGCRYLHTANVSDHESHAWIDQLTDESIADSVATGIVRRCQAGMQNEVAYLISKRTPDPNNPERNVTNLWLFVDPRRQLLSSQLNQFAKDPWFAASQEEFEFTMHHALRQLPSGTVSQSEYSVAPVWTKATMAIGMTTKILAVLTVAAVGIVAGWRWYIDTSDKGPINDPPNVRTPSIDPQWSAEIIRGQIVSAINDAEVIEGSAGDLDDQKLLKTFTELFRISDTELGLNATDRANMDARRKSEPPHPFLAFLDHFPREIPMIDSGENKTWPELCTATLIPLAKCFGDAIKAEAPTGFSLEDANPREIIQTLRNQLNYRDFYKTWHDIESPGDDEEPFVDWGSNDPAYRWQRKVRDYIKKHY